MNWQPLRAWRLRGESAPELDRKRRGSAKERGENLADQARTCGTVL